MFVFRRPRGNENDHPSLPYFSSASQNTLFSVSLPQPLMTTPFSAPPDSSETMAPYKFITYLPVGAYIIATRPTFSILEENEGSVHRVAQKVIFYRIYQ